MLLLFSVFSLSCRSFSIAFFSRLLAEEQGTRFICFFPPTPTLGTRKPVFQTPGFLPDPKKVRAPVDRKIVLTPFFSPGLVDGCPSYCRFLPCSVFFFSRTKFYQRILNLEAGFFSLFPLLDSTPVVCPSFPSTNFIFV